MKTAILTIALALASALSALAQTVMRENSTVYFQTNVYLHDDSTNALHYRISTAVPMMYGGFWEFSSDGGDSEGVRYLSSEDGFKLDFSSGEATGIWTYDYANLRSPLISGRAVVAANTTNVFLRPDGGTNTISFDGSGSMIVAVDGTAAMTISTNGNVGIGISGGRLEADEIKADKIVLATVSQQGFEAWLQSDGTNLFFVSTVPPGLTNALTTNTP